MKNKIQKLINSPVMISEKDMETFRTIMKLDDKKVNILKEAQNIIRKHYLSQPLNENDNKILNLAIELLYPNNSKQNTTSLNVTTTNSLSTIQLNIEELLNFYLNYTYSLFMITSPVYYLVVHFYNYHLDNIKHDDDQDELMYYIKNLSDKHEMENIIIKQEKEFKNLFIEITKTTHMDLSNILQCNLGTLFSYNNNTIDQIKQILINSRNIVLPKINETFYAYNQLNNFLIQTDQDTTGAALKGFLKGGALGAAAASLFGPLGIAAAIGATILGSNEEEEKRSKMLTELYDNWSKVVDMLYINNLKDYYFAYDSLTKKIINQLKENFFTIYKRAIKIKKDKDLLDYLYNEKRNIENNTKLLEIIKESKDLKQFFS